MEIKITQQQYNPLLKRKEIAFRVEHTQTKGTPSRLEIRQKLAEALKASMESVYVRRVQTKTGTMTATGEAYVYDMVGQAKIVEPHYIVIRNVPKEKTEGKSEAPKALTKVEGAGGQLND